MPLVRLMPAVDHATLQHHYVRGGRDGILAAIAIELYRRRHATWPESLGALTPSLLPAVPIDRFDGQPLRYRIVEGRPVIYSIGSDLDDDGGRPALRQADGKPENAAARKWRSREAVEQARRQRNFDQASSNWLPDGDWVIWPPSE